jgi:hypothetical protein
MSSTIGAGSGKKSTTTVEHLAKRFAVMEDLIRPLQPLVEQGHQQRTMNLALLCLEQGDDAPPPAAAAPMQQGAQGDTNTNGSVTCTPIHH